jgi:uncharacterized membrane protein YcfT
VTDARLALNAARGQALVVVVLFHAFILLYPRGMVYWGYQYAIDVLTYIPMPVLFFISGLKFKHLVAQKNNRQLSSRIAVYGYLYAFWTMVYVTFQIAFGDRIIDMEAPTFYKVALSLVFPTTVLWFLYSIALYFFCARLIARLNAWFQVAIGAAVALCAYVPTFVFDSTLMYKVAGHFIYFLVGVNFGARLLDAVFKPNWAVVAAVVAAYPALLLLARLAGVPQSPGVVEVMGTLGIVFFMVMSAVSLRLRLKRFFQMVGRNALPIYLLHSLFLKVLVVAWAWLGLSGISPVFKLLNPILLGAAAIYASLVAYRTLRSVPGLFFAPVGMLKPLSSLINRVVDRGVRWRPT